MKGKPNEMFSDFSGSTGNITASHAAGHMVVRNKTIPRYTDTDYQKVVRQNFSLFTKQWKSLTDSQRAAWAAKAVEASSNRETFGINGKMSGFNLYVRCNMNLKLVGVDPALELPSDEVATIPPVFDSIVLSENALSVNLSANVGASDIAVIRITPLTTGQSTNVNGLRQTGQIAGGEKTANILQKYTEIFNAPKAGDKVQIQIYSIHKSSGFASVRQLYVTNITEAENPAV